jgi:hypothetical protein
VAAGSAVTLGRVGRQTAAAGRSNPLRKAELQASRNDLAHLRSTLLIAGLHGLAVDNYADDSNSASSLDLAAQAAYDPAAKPDEVRSIPERDRARFR